MAPYVGKIFFSKRRAAGEVEILYGSAFTLAQGALEFGQLFAAFAQPVARPLRNKICAAKQAFSFGLFCIY